MWRFFVISLVVTSLLLVEGRSVRRKNSTPTPNSKSSSIQRTRTGTRRVVVYRKEVVTTPPVSNRHRRALPISSGVEEKEENKISEDTRPCVLHSIRYGCMCRYGDLRCLPESNPVFFSKNFDDY